MSWRSLAALDISDKRDSSYARFFASASSTTRLESSSSSSDTLCLRSTTSYRSLLRVVRSVYYPSFSSYSISLFPDSSFSSLVISFRNCLISSLVWDSLSSAPFSEDSSDLFSFNAFYILSCMLLISALRSSMSCFYFSRSRARTASYWRSFSFSASFIATCYRSAIFLPVASDINWVLATKSV